MQCLWHFAEYLENVCEYLIVLVPKCMIFRGTFLCYNLYYNHKIPKSCVESDTKYSKISAVITIISVYLQTRNCLDVFFCVASL